MLLSQWAKLLKQTASLVVCSVSRESMESLWCFHECYKAISTWDDLDLDPAIQRKMG